jgi:hypothetical protein
MVDKSHVDSLMKCIIVLLLQKGGLDQDVVKFTFGVDDVSIFLGLRYGVMVHISESWAPFNFGIYYVYHCTNLVHCKPCLLFL